MDKFGYDFRIQRAETDKDIKYFKQWLTVGLCNRLVYFTLG
jgi:hypothetical protein